MKLIDRCISCKYFKEKYSYDFGSLQNGKVMKITAIENNFCTHENFVTTGVIPEPENFGCIFWEEKHS